MRRSTRIAAQTPVKSAPSKRVHVDTPHPKPRRQPVKSQSPVSRRAAASPSPPPAPSRSQPGGTNLLTHLVLAAIGVASMAAMLGMSAMLGAFYFKYYTGIDVLGSEQL